MMLERSLKLQPIHYHTMAFPSTHETADGKQLDVSGRPKAIRRSIWKPWLPHADLDMFVAAWNTLLNSDRLPARF